MSDELRVGEVIVQPINGGRCHELQRRHSNTCWHLSENNQMFMQYVLVHKRLSFIVIFGESSVINM